MIDQKSLTKHVSFVPKKCQKRDLKSQAKLIVMFLMSFFLFYKAIDL